MRRSVRVDEGRGGGCHWEGVRWARDGGARVSGYGWMICVVMCQRNVGDKSSHKNYSSSREKEAALRHQ